MSARHASPAAARLLLALGFAAIAGGAPAQDLSQLPDYTPARRVSGLLTSWGSNQMAAVMKRWEDGFRRYQPGVSFSDKLKGNTSAQYGLQLAIADMALMSRQVVPYDVYGIWRRSHKDPVEIEVATGSYDIPQKSFALTVFVHADNPVSGLCLDQLDRIFGAARTGGWRGMDWSAASARDEKDLIRTWGQVGLTGAWADRVIHPYGPPGLSPGGMSFFQMRVMGGADTWSDELREFGDRREMMKALGADPAGIAYTGMCYRTPSVKPVALAETRAGPYVAPSRKTVADRTYPLARSIYIYFAPDRQTGDPADPAIEPRLREFLRYVLSRQGQEEVVRAGDFLPLTPGIARSQLKKLE